jgi:baculoviral IAP repeat-containing protein 6 (apollon)
LLIPDIQETAALVQSATFSEMNLREEKNQASNSSIELPIAKSIENRYLEIMKKLQFGKKV